MIKVTTGKEEFDPRITEPTRVDGKSVRDAHMTIAVFVLGKHLASAIGKPLIAIYDGDHYQFADPASGEAVRFASQSIYKWRRLVIPYRDHEQPVDDFDPDEHTFWYGPES